MTMKIHTELVKNKKISSPISSNLLKHSQEYRVLAILRYLFPNKYNTMVAGESPDLQDYTNSVGIEVVSAVQENDMKVQSEFSKYYQELDTLKKEKILNKIKENKYSIVEIQKDKYTISCFGTSKSEKNVFQNTIRRKRIKIELYKGKFEKLGLAIILPSIPTSETEKNYIRWILEVRKEKDIFFDFVYIVSNRFCIYCDLNGNYEKSSITDDEYLLLSTIARMTAEGDLDLNSIEWN